ncbi:MAG: hypothetical protein JJT96_19900 [Opitutales bacterium]|nr:hypothetical protein [Opitutales bacterium]
MEPYPVFDDDRPDSVFEEAAGEMPMDAGADLLKFARMDAEILGPSRVRRELMAFEQAVEKVHPAVREVLEQSLRAEFREVREFKA